LNTVFFDSAASDETRRSHLYEGQLFAYKSLPSSLALSEFAAEMSGAALAPFDPRQAQHPSPTRLSEEIIGMYDTPPHTEARGFGCVGPQWKA
jgi:hypothetical protein